MKIVLMNEFSQASKNPIIWKELDEVTKKLGHTASNLGMTGDDDYRLTYIHLGIMSAILLNSGAADFVVTGCGTGQGALMSLNTFPGVACGYCIDPVDAYLFLQINNGNALSLPYAKGFGWGSDLNLKFIFEKAFGSEKGQGYPNEPKFKESQNRNASLLMGMKANVGKDIMEALESIDQELLETAVNSPALQAYMKENCQKPEFLAFMEKYTK